jgi:hypothetical protein
MFKENKKKLLPTKSPLIFNNSIKMLKNNKKIQKVYWTGVAILAAPLLELDKAYRTRQIRSRHANSSKNQHKRITPIADE